LIFLEEQLEPKINPIHQNILFSVLLLFITCSINSSGTLDAGIKGLEPKIIPVLPRAVRIK